MDIFRELEEHAATGSRAAADHLIAHATKAQVRARIAQGRRVATARLATGVAMAAVVLVTAGAWVAPRVFVEPAGPTPSAPPTQTHQPLPTPTPTPTVARWSPEPYVATPSSELPKLGDEGYLSAVTAVANIGGRLDCTDTSEVEVLAPDAPPEYPSPVRSWIGSQHLYDSAPVLIYSADEPGYAAVAADYVKTYPEDQIHWLILINSAGGYWGYKLSVFENNGSVAGDPGIYAWYTYQGGCGGGNRTYGGPLPEGFYDARLLSVSNTIGGDSRVLDLGTVEVGP